MHRHNIEYCLADLHPTDVGKFKRQLSVDKADMLEYAHVCKDLAVGTFLRKHGIDARYEVDIGGLTPDWCVYSDSGKIGAIIEVYNYHLDRATQSIIGRQHSHGTWATYWISHETQCKQDEARPKINRLYQAIQTKAIRYRSLIVTIGVPYVVTVFGHFETALTEADLRHVLGGEQHHLFAENPHLSGVLGSCESSGVYRFCYIANEHATRPYSLPAGRLAPCEEGGYHR